MKICIIGFPRSRSSLLLDTISMFHGLPILGEDINEIMDKRVDYFKKIQVLLENIRNTDKGVIRLHPLQFASDPVALANLSWFNFEQYDKIYFTFRESAIDNIASNFVAETLKKFTYKSQDEVLESPGPFYFRDKDFWHVRDYFDSMRIANYIKAYMAENNLQYEELYYNDIPQYVEEHFPGVKSNHTETHYNYKHAVMNYNDIEKLYTRMKDEC